MSLSAVWSWRKKPKKSGNPLFERPQPSPAFNNLRVPAVIAQAYGENETDELKASRSSPFLSVDVSSTGPGGGGPQSVLPSQLLSTSKFSESPAPKLRASPLETSSLAPPSFLQGGHSASHLLGDSRSAVSLIDGDDDLAASPSSPGMSKDWKTMQVLYAVAAPPPFSKSETTRIIISLSFSLSLPLCSKQRSLTG